MNYGKLFVHGIDAETQKFPWKLKLNIFDIFIISEIKFFFISIKFKYHMIL